MNNLKVLNTIDNMDESKIPKEVKKDEPLGVIWWDNKEYDDIYYVERICKIKNLDFEKCSNIRTEEYDLYAPKLCFDYVQ